MKLDMSFLPDGKSGEWEISSFEVKKRELSEMMSMFKTGRGVPEGNYKKLMRGRTVVMSNTPDEISDFSYFTYRAKGSILINGLGLGCVVKVLLEKSEIEKIKVIENSSDVINLVAPYFKDERLSIIHQDAFNFKPNKEDKFDFVWHDIWDDICSDNLKEMTILHRKYGRKTKWQDSWAKGECQRQKREYEKENKYYSFFK